MLSPFRSPPRYEVEEDPEFPPDGNWRVPTFHFDQTGVSTAPRESQSVIVRVKTVDDYRWVGMFAEGLWGLYGVFATPDPGRVCCVARGFAYVVDVADPAAAFELAHTDTTAVTAVPEADRLLLSGFIDITAIGHGGVVWRSGRLVLDDLAIVETPRDRIVCTGSIIPGDEMARVVLDAGTGQILEGEPPEWLRS
jgi:hypothetical protein